MADQSKSGSTRGGTSQQHAEAGKQSHKNDHVSKDSAGSEKTRGGSSQQHAEAGRQSHKND